MCVTVCIYFAHMEIESDFASLHIVTIFTSCDQNISNILLVQGYVPCVLESPILRFKIIVEYLEYLPLDNKCIIFGHSKLIHKLYLFLLILRAD